MDNRYRIIAAFKYDRFLVIVEGDDVDPTRHRLRIAELITLDDRANLDYWAAPSLARAMQQAAEYYAEEMEKSKTEMASSSSPTHE
jgi:hypothetical protein